MKKSLLLISLVIISTGLSAQNDENTLYMDGEINETQWNAFIEKSLNAVGMRSQTSWDIIPNGVDDEDNAPYYFYLKKNFSVGNTFNKKLSLSSGQSINVTVTNSTGDYIVLMFRVDSPSMFSYAYGYSPQSTHNTKTFTRTVNATGNYMVLIVSSTNNTTCGVTLNGISYPNQQLNSNLLYCVQGTGKEYNTFTSQSTDSLQMAIVSQSGKVISYCREYPWHVGTYLPKEVRVYQSFPSTVNSIILIPRHPVASSIHTDVYAKCEAPYHTINEQTGFVEGNNYFNLYNYVTYPDEQFIISYPWIPGYMQQGGTGSYNSHAWSVGAWLEWASPPTSEISYDNAFTNLYCYDHYYEGFGFTRTGATEENSVIDLYGKPNENGKMIVRLSSVKSYSNDVSYGYSWETKLGGYERMMHPRDIFDNDSSEFGTVIARYRRIPNYVSNGIIYENVSFTAEERNQIDNMANNVSSPDRMKFEDLYSKCTQELMKSGANSLDWLDDCQEYKKLQDMYLLNANVFYLACQKLAEGDWMICKSILDQSYQDHLTTWKCIDDIFEAKGRKTEDDMILHRTLNAKTTAYIKALLYQNKNSNLDGFALDGISYSDDDSILSVSNSGRTLDVYYSLGEKSKVTVRVDTQYGTNVDVLRNGCEMEQGTYHEIVQLPSRGIYVVSLQLNGKLYTKKINVQ